MLSIITPVLNGATFIEKNIQSILSLNINFEHIIVDGGSTDETLGILKKYPHLTVIHQKDKLGMYSAINEGFMVAKYEYITWINADDIIISDNFSNAVLNAKKNNYDFVYGNSLFNFTKLNKSKFIKANRFGKFFLNKYILPFVQPSSFYKKEIYFLNPFNYQNFKIAGDLDFFNRLSTKKNINFHYCNKTLSVFLKYGESLGDKNNKLYNLEYKKLNSRKSPIYSLLYKLTRHL
jgi:glycosyltransferase involved in cell wall biosynthesis